MKRTLFAIAALFALPLGAAADPAVGIWKTPPDRKNLTSHIEVRLCGPALCGRIIQAFDASGKPVMTKNVGKELFWGVEPMGGGAYGNGTAWVPLLNVQAKASMQLAGNRLTVKGCKGVVCDKQVWSRL